MNVLLPRGTELPAPTVAGPLRASVSWYPAAGEPHRVGDSVEKSKGVGRKSLTIETSVIVLSVISVALIAAALLRRQRARMVLLAGGLSAALTALAVGINTDWLIGLDTSIVEWFDHHRTLRRDHEAGDAFSYIGRPLHVLTAAMVCGTALSVWRRSVVPLVLITGAVGLGVVVEQTLKATIGRTVVEGPLLKYVHSFPSGHVTGTAALLGSIAVCLGVGLGRAAKVRLGALVAVGVVVVAYLAVYTGAHTFTDVIGGMFLGGAIVALCAAALTVSASRRSEPSVGLRVDS